jgi:hypothetical protein
MPHPSNLVCLFAHAPSRHDMARPDWIAMRGAAAWNAAEALSPTVLIRPSVLAGFARCSGSAQLVFSNMQRFSP